MPGPTRIEVGSDPSLVRARDVWIFAWLTVAISMAVLLMAPGVAGAAVVVFVPTVLATVILGRRSGAAAVRSQLFSGEAWRSTGIWVVIALGVALALRLGVNALSLLFDLDHRVEVGTLSPVLVAVFVFAAAEEIGWRGFALPALLANGMAPLRAALLLGLPWAVLHLPLVLSGQMNAGASPLAVTITIMSLGVILTWGYLASGWSLLVATLIHGGQNALSVLNGTGSVDGITLEWSMAVVYALYAVLIVWKTRGRLGLRHDSTPEV